jgi:hypothetical protein
VLIDFGTTELPDGAPSGLMAAIASDIATRCNGKLDVVVATHRHKDHISGFGRTQAGNSAGDIIATLKPARVIQPWTEHPKTKATSTSAPSVFALAPRNSRAFSDVVANASEDVAGEISRLLRTQLSFRDRTGLSEARAEVQHSLKNQNLVDGLRELAKQAGNKGGAYVSSGKSAGLSSILPGIKVTVLGPPTLKQVAKADLKYAPNSSPEYWMQLSAELRLADRRSRARGTRGTGGGSAPAYARWIIARLRSERARTLQRIVTALDTYLNNTSVILLFEVGQQALLFPGDAQLENWTWAASQFADKIPGVTVYKVGHHGSMNATPKSLLWDRLTHKGGPGTAGRLVTLLSSKEGKHGTVHEVPRTALVNELKAQSSLFSTVGASADAVPTQVSITF